MLIVYDPGHGGDDRANRGPTGYIEADGVLDMALRARAPVIGAGLDLRYTRETDKTVALYDRPALANQWGAALLVSWHTNAADDPKAEGIETFYSKNGEWGDKFHAQARLVAEAVQQELVAATGLKDRGIKTRLVDRTDSPIHGMDYYAVIRRANCPAIIVEIGFHTNSREEALLKTAEFRQKAAMAVTEGIKRIYGKMTPIMAPAPATVEQAQAWALARNATETFIELAPLYWQLAPVRGGVNPAGAYAQAAKETAFGRFGGVIDESYRNPCGIKTKSGGDNGDPNAHQRFSSWEEGIMAHLDHLALYAGAPGYPRVDTPDPRHFTWIAGTAVTFEALGGKWAPSLDYGKSIIRDYLAGLLGTQAPILVDPELQRLRVENEQLRGENEQLKGRIQAALRALSAAS